MKSENKAKGLLIDRINELCDEKELSYYTLSYKASIPLTTLIHIMEGHTKNPGVFTIMKICDGLGITLKEFFDTKEFDKAVIDSRDEN